MQMSPPPFSNRSPSMLDNILLGLMILGSCLYLAGRLLIIRDVAADYGWFWNLMRFVPLAELLFLVQFYQRAKLGGMLAIFGMCLAVPWLGNEYSRMRGSETEPAAEEEFLAPSLEIKLRQERVLLLEARLTGWYQQIEQRRATAAANPASISAYNAEVAAYSALNAVAREERAELAALQTGRK